MSHEPSGFVYFIQAVMSDGLIKIGSSQHPQGRLGAFRIGSPVPLNPLGIISSNRFVEHELHRRFKDLRSHGEWFRADPILLDFIREHAEPWPAPRAQPASPASRHRLDRFGAGRTPASEAQAQIARDMAMARMRADRATNEEIARFFKCTARTVQRRVNALPEHARARMIGQPE